jgi:hypothetical protein
MDKYFALKLEHGLSPDGNPQPLVEIGVAVAVPIMVQTKNGPELAQDAQRYVIREGETLKEGELARFIPGTRIVHVADPRIETAIRDTNLFVETDKPTRAAIDKERKQLLDSAQEAGTHNGDPDPTNPDNPVTDDQKTEG